MAKSSNTLSPMMEHYFEVKKKYPGTIVMYRLGDFYEMFFDDAVDASKILDLTLTGRDCGLTSRAPMCGVPYHAVDSYISKLVKCGKKVAICEQLSDPKASKGMVDRDVVRIVTPGTVTDDDMLEGGNNNYLLAIHVQNNASALAYADVSTGDVTMTEIDDIGAKLEDFLMALVPAEVICDAKTFNIISSIDCFRQGKVARPEQYYDYSFNADTATGKIIEFYKINNLKAVDLRGDEHEICALGALLDYLESTQKRILAHIKVPVKLKNDAGMFLDYNTKRNLELIETLNEKNKIGSLLGVLDETVTNMGARYMRKWVQEPLRSADLINARLDAVQELYVKSDMREELRESLSHVKDLERLCNKIAYGSINPRDCLAICGSLAKIPVIKKTIQTAKSGNLQRIYKALNPMQELAEHIFNMISEDALATMKDGRYIKSGYNEELDGYRNAQSNAHDWFRKFESKVKEETGIKNLKVGYNKVFGYYIEVTNSFLNMVPKSFERRQTLTTGERYITPELKKMEETVLGAEEKALKLEEKLYAELKALLFDAIGILQMNAKLIGTLDCFVSFAGVAVKYKYTRPIINDKVKKINIIGGRHPVVERMSKGADFVENDCNIDDESRMLIITGPNMAGKSTYMRQVALITLMAHIGCFVPAGNAEICPMDRIFTRIGASDNLAFGQSTFMVEMTEMANILNYATDKSLLILDEIGRGTSTVDGLSIAWAIVEQIALRIKAKTLFATHYHEMSVLENIIPCVRNYHILINESNGGITFLYKVARGSANKSFGIEVAALAGVNGTVIERASQILNVIESNNDANKDFGNLITSAHTEEAVPVKQIGLFDETDSKYDEIINVLNDINLDNCTPMQAMTILADIKKQFVPAGYGKKKAKK